MSANFLGREKGYRNVTGFSEGNTSVAEHFSPAATYSERIDQLFEEVAAMGYKGIDLWTAHCNPQWATPQHLDGLLAASNKHQLELVSIAGGLSTLEALEQCCKLARDIRCPLLGLGCRVLPQHIDQVQQVLQRYNIRLAFENHPNEPTPQVVLEKIGYGRYPRIGSTFDTGWWGTHDYPLLQALDTLQEHILLVHLKNIQSAGAHVAAPTDQGHLELKPVIQSLRTAGYTGWISIEYEPLDRDPTEDCRASLQTATQWWNSAT